MIIEKILRVFGLMTIAEAKCITRITVSALQSANSSYVLEDFGVYPLKTAQSDIAKWSDENFDRQINAPPYHPVVFETPQFTK